MDELSHAIETIMNGEAVENTIIITGDFTVTGDIYIEQAWIPRYRPTTVTLTVPEGESHTLFVGDNIDSMFLVMDGGMLTIAENAGGVLTLDGKGKAGTICQVTDWGQFLETIETIIIGSSLPAYLYLTEEISSIVREMLYLLVWEHFTSRRELSATMQKAGFPKAMW